MKPVIDALKEGKKTWSDLRKLDIPEKTLARILREYLEYFRLVRKEGDFWVWYENVGVVFSSKDEYDLALEHSKKLFPQFKQMLQYSAHYKDPTVYLAMREHLKSYPEIYRRLEKFEKAFAGLNEKLLQNKEMLAQHQVNAELGGPFRFSIFYDEWNPATSKESELKDKLGKELKSFLDIYRPLAGDISLLETRIDYGHPLEGTCPLCPPKVKIVGR
jgi:tetratricopeptide (TPR) repeat protein